MGNQQSHNTQNIQQYRQNIVRNAFDQQCDTTTSCSQTITMGNVNIHATDNCNVTVSNNCEANNYAECNMDNTFDDLFFQLKNSGDTELQNHIGGLLQDSNGKGGFNSQTIHSTNISDVKNSFNQKCSANFGGYQQITTGDFTLDCDGNANVIYDNKILNNSRCATEMANSVSADGTASTRGNSAPITSTLSPNPTPTPTPEPSNQYLYIIGGIFLVLVLILAFKK